MAIIERGRKARGNSATFAIVELRGYGATFWVSDYGALTCPTPAAAHGLLYHRKSSSCSFATRIKL
jgi:hypothetical protein